MSIGIIGAGNIGLAVAKTLSRAGIAATIANSQGPDSLKESVGALGPTIKAGTREQADSADIVLIAVNWSKLPAAVAGLPTWDGRIVIDANNPIEAPLFKPVELHGRISGQVVAELVSGARLVKAFNHLRADVLASDPATTLVRSLSAASSHNFPADHCRTRTSSGSGDPTNGTHGLSDALA
jgi:predicted dinucleotide-binding enzyme